MEQENNVERKRIQKEEHRLVLFIHFLLVCTGWVFTGPPK